MDFVHDQLATGKKIRVLTVVDTFSRYSPVARSAVQLSRRGRRADAGTGLPEDRLSEDDPGRPGLRVRLARSGSVGLPKGVTLDFSRPGKPTDNAFIEAFNGRFRAECLNAHWFLTLADAAEKMEDWRKDRAGSGNLDSGISGVSA